METDYKIFTSYFAKWKFIPESYYKINISLYPPKWLGNIPSFKELMPTDEILREYQREPNQFRYNRDYMELLNDRFPNLKSIGEKLTDIYKSNYKYGIVMFCYENPDRFCHRHIVTGVLNTNGFKCKEFENYGKYNTNSTKRT
jgi:hypothetical protein